MARGQVASAMLCVYPETREKVRERKDDRSYDQYIRHLLEIEDKYTDG